MARTVYVWNQITGLALIAGFLYLVRDLSSGFAPQWSGYWGPAFQAMALTLGWVPVRLAFAADAAAWCWLWRIRRGFLGDPSRWGKQLFAWLLVAVCTNVLTVILMAPSMRQIVLFDLPTAGRPFLIGSLVALVICSILSITAIPFITPRSHEFSRRLRHVEQVANYCPSCRKEFEAGVQCTKCGTALRPCGYCAACKAEYLLDVGENCPDHNTPLVLHRQPVQQESPLRLLKDIMKGRRLLPSEDSETISTDKV